MNNDYLLLKRILLVDDEQELLDMVVSILNAYGFRNIRTAKSTKEAMEEAERFRPELAILDVMLPDGSGFELMEQLKSGGDYPILFLTARGEEDDKFRGFGLGADDYIVKPFLPKELFSVLWQSCADAIRTKIRSCSYTAARLIFRVPRSLRIMSIFR